MWRKASEKLLEKNLRNKYLVFTVLIFQKNNLAYNWDTDANILKKYSAQKEYGMNMN